MCENDVPSQPLAQMHHLIPAVRSIVPEHVLSVSGAFKVPLEAIPYRLCSCARRRVRVPVINMELWVVEMIAWTHRMEVILVQNARAQKHGLHRVVLQDLLQCQHICHGIVGALQFPAEQSEIHIPHRVAVEHLARGVHAVQQAHARVH